MFVSIQVAIFLFISLINIFSVSANNSSAPSTPKSPGAATADCGCSKELSPVCANGKDFPNNCVAKCQGVKESDMKSGLCSANGGSPKSAEDNCLCDRSLFPVCAKGKEFANSCLAKCEGMQDSDIKPGNCPTTA